MEELLASNTAGTAAGIVDGAPLVSVVIPVYNAGEYLRGALDSLRAQSYRNFEAILVEDGSTDGSAEVCREYVAKDARFRLVAQTNAGVSAARNAGIDASRGSWIAFSDADDLLYPDSLSLMVEVATSTDAPVVAAKYTKGKNQTKEAGSGKVEIVSSDSAIELGLYQKQILNNPWGMLFSAAIFQGEDSPRFRPGRYEDLDIFYRIFERADKVALLDRTVYFYRDNPKSFINTWSESRLDALDVTDRIVDHYRLRLETNPSETSQRLLKAALDRRFSAHFNILLLMARNGINQQDQRERCQKVIREQRISELSDPNVRWKNKIGALLSYGGRPLLNLLAKLY